MMRKGNAKQRICEAMLDLLTEKSIKDVTVTEVVKRAGINRSTYYYHFYEPEEVVDYLIDGFIGLFADCFRTYIPRRGEDFPQQPLAFDLCEIIYRERRLVSVMLNSPDYRGPFEARVMNGIEQFLRHYVLIAADTDGNLVRVGKGLELDFYRYFTAAGLVSTMCMWNDDGFETSLQELTNSLAGYSALELVSLEKRGVGGGA